MADNTRSIQECKKLEGMFLEFAEQMRQLVANNAAELVEIKQSLATRTHSPAGGEELSHISGEPSFHTNLRRDSGVGQNAYTAPTRQTRVDFPRFAGEDLRGWLYRCENFFELDATPWDMKVRVAAVHLEGRALQWHQMYMQKRATREVPHWEEYAQALHIRFGTTVFEDPMAELMKLRQTGELEACLETFEALLGRVSLPEEYAISCLLAAIREDIADVVRMHRPKSLLEAYALARQQNINLKHSRGRTHTFLGSVPRVVGGAPKPVANYNEGQKITVETGLLPTPRRHPMANAPYSRRLTSAEMDEKRRKSICFWCDEKYTAGHKCRNRQLHMVTIDRLEGMLDEEEEPEGATEEEASENTAQLSLCALTGAVHEPRCNTMRVIGEVKRSSLNILVDSGSTHNFLDTHRAKRMGCVIEAITPVSVAIANGERLICREICRNFGWKVQGYDFSVDVFLIRLGGCDMVLGVEWLATLGDILWNFQECTMKFTQGERDHVLRGSKEGRQQELEVKAFERVVYKSSNSIAPVMRYLILTQFVRECQSLQLTAEGSKEHNREVQTLIQQFQDVFMEPKMLPPHRSCDHKIPLKQGADAINLRPYRYSVLQKDSLEGIIKDMLQAGTIQPSNSPYSSPVVLVKKKDGSWRMCIDYRALNSQTIKDKYPIPLIEELLDELHGAEVFSKLDLRSGYHQIRMSPEDVPKTAFKTHDGHYEFVVMPFGLTNAPSTFQNLMNEVFREHLRKFVLVFFDDILVYSSNLKDHLNHLGTVLEVLRRNRLFAKQSKCFFACGSVDYLGHIISGDGVATDPLKISAVEEWPTPKNVRQLRGFLGLTGYYRRFIRNYGQISRPLTNLLKKEKYDWREESQAAFVQLKQVLTSAPVLALPDFSQTFIVETDASGEGIGAVLMQNSKPIAYLSKAISDKHRALSVYDKELMAVVFAVTKWHHYLLGRHFIIRTDHRSLQYLLTQKVHSAGQLKWLAKLLAFDYEIQHKKGRDNAAADALSRVTGAELMAVTLSAVDSTLLQEVTSSWERDLKLQRIRDQLQSGTLTNNKYSWNGTLLQRKGRIVVGNNAELRNKVIRLFHCSSIGGHSGVGATTKRIAAVFYWKGLEKEVRNVIRECDVCQRCKYDRASSPGLLQPLPIPVDVWQEVSMDFIEGLPKSGGKDVIMVVVDRFSKYAHFIALQHPYTAANVAQAYIDYVYKLHGLPRIMVSDRDSVFLSRFWQHFFRLQGVDLHYSTAYHPQSDGQTEVVNRCLETYLRCMTGECPTKWGSWLSLAEYWYNTTFHSSLKLTPFQALYGYPPPVQVSYVPGDSTLPAVDQRMRDRNCMIAVLRSNLLKAQQRMKVQADKHRSERQFEKGDWVYVKLQPYRQRTLLKQTYSKLASLYYGPFQVKEKIGTVAYKLALPPSCSIHPTFHVSKLKRSLGSGKTALITLPRSLDVTLAIPVAILDRRMVQKGNRAAAQVLVQWSNGTVEEATWEFYYDLQRKFPDLALDKLKHG